MEAMSWTFQPYPGGTGALLEKTYREKGVAAFTRQPFAWSAGTPGAFYVQPWGSAALPATDEEIAAAARAVGAADFITALEHGYETQVGERGVQLSAGQRQLLAFARALVADPRILVLDEATSALDSESELLVQEALMNLMMNRTSFVIAHRLSTIRRADAIIVLERGRVVEIGRHDELLARPDGAYAGLYQMQLLESRKGERTRMVPS